MGNRINWVDFKFDYALWRTNFIGKMREKPSFSRFSGYFRCSVCCVYCSLSRTQNPCYFPPKHHSSHPVCCFPLSSLSVCILPSSGSQFVPSFPFQRSTVHRIRGRRIVSIILPHNRSPLFAHPL